VLLSILKAFNAKKNTSPARLRLIPSDEKRVLYFDAGANEVWMCALDGSMSFFLAPNQQSGASTICPNFPTSIP
jgi:hypothetical protein